MISSAGRLRVLPQLARLSSRMANGGFLWKVVPLSLAVGIWNGHHQVKRTFFTSSLGDNDESDRQRLMVLERSANSMPSDANRQADLYEYWKRMGEFKAIIRRFEDSHFSRNHQCVLAYLEALYETNQLDRAVRFFLDRNNVNLDAATDAIKQHRQAEPMMTAASSNAVDLAALLNFGTKERPIHVTGLGQMQGSGGSGGRWRRISGMISWLIFISLILYSTGNLGGDGSGPGRLGGFGSKAHKMFDAGEQQVTFDDVLGCDEAKEQLVEVVDFLKDPQRFNRLGARMPKGVLLIGPPGTGKTLLARAVAGEAGVPFYYASGSQFDEVFVGVGSMRIRQMFEAAKEQAPAIIFIDEIDAIASQRNARDPQHSRMSLNQLLTELDGFETNTGVIVIAATNLPDSLDHALLRPGRFDRHVHVPLPDVRGRQQIIEHYLYKVPSDHLLHHQQHPKLLAGRNSSMNSTRLSSSSPMVGSDVDASVLARATPGFSGADLFKVINEARIRASVERARMLTMSHLEEAKDQVMMGSERKSLLLTEEDRRLTAFHEGGHALVALHTPDAMDIHKATIVPRGRALGMVAQLPSGDEVSVSRSQLLARMDVAMGGRFAEELVFGSEKITTGASSDFEQATAIARAMVMQYGMSDAVGPISVRPDQVEDLSAETRAIIDAEVRRLLRESSDRVRSLLMTHRSMLDRLAEALLEHETLDKCQLQDLVQGRPVTVHSKQMVGPSGLQRNRDESSSSSSPPSSSRRPAVTVDIVL